LSPHLPAVVKGRLFHRDTRTVIEAAYAARASRCLLRKRIDKIG
jgi:hypothetical protein